MGGGRAVDHGVDFAEHPIAGPLLLKDPGSCHIAGEDPDPAGRVRLRLAVLGEPGAKRTPTVLADEEVDLVASLSEAAEQDTA